MTDEDAKEMTDEDAKEISKSEDIMIEGFLYISKKGGLRASKTRCGTKDGEVRAAVKVSVPLSLFESDALNVEIHIPESLRTDLDASAHAERGTW